MKDKQKSEDKKVYESRRPLTDGRVKDTETGYVTTWPVTQDRDDFHKDLPTNTF